MYQGKTKKRAAEFVAWLENRGAESLFFQPLSDTEFFRHALEKEAEFGRPRPLSIRVAGEEFRAGKPSFDRVSLRFRLSARNDADLEAPFEVGVMMVDGASATFEAPDFGAIALGDRLVILAEIEQGETKTEFRIQGAVKERAGAGILTLGFDELNRVRLETAMTKVAKRFKELKDFFKYAKGA